MKAQEKGATVGPFSRPVGGSKTTWAVLPTVLLFCLTQSACDRKKDDEKAPTAPWRKDAQPSLDDARALLKYSVDPASELSVVLPTRRTRPTGTFTAVTGTLELVPDLLQHVRGHIDVDLRSLEMDDTLELDEAWTAKLSPSVVATLKASSWTEQARNWLHLAPSTPGDPSAFRARFEFDSARQLSHPRASAGAVRKVEPESGHAHARQVYATVVGTLALANVSVTRSVDVSVQFLYDEDVDAGAEPASLEVTIRGKWSVPLSEYDVAPRNASGEKDSEMAPIVGTLVGSTAYVTGSIQLKRTGF